MSTHQPAPSHHRDVISRWSHSQPCSSSMPPPKRHAAARNLNFTYHSSPFSRPESSTSTSSESSRTSRMSVFSSQSRPESSSTCDSLDPFSSPSIPVKRPETANKCVQTEENGENLLEKLAGDRDFAMGCLKKLMEKEKFGELVAMMRDQIRSMSDSEKETFEKVKFKQKKLFKNVLL